MHYVTLSPPGEKCGLGALTRQAAVQDALQQIYNYRKLSDRLATAGQPGEAQFGSIARAGFDVVINLGLLDTEYALPDEAALVNALGLVYEHVQVSWECPQSADLERFFGLMARYAGKKVFVHCAANMRVSVFVALHRILEQGWRRQQAMSDVLAIWEPDHTWQAFIEAALAQRPTADPLHDSAPDSDATKIKG